MDLVIRHTLDVEGAAIFQLQQEQHIAVDLVLRCHLELGDHLVQVRDRALAGVEADGHLNVRLHFARAQALAERMSRARLICNFSF